MSAPCHTTPQRISAGQPIGAAMLLDIISEARSAMLEAAAMKRRADQAVQAFARQQGQHFARRRSFLGEGRRTGREPLTPLPCRAEIDMDEALGLPALRRSRARARLEAATIITAAAILIAAALNLMGVTL